MFITCRNGRDHRSGVRDQGDAERVDETQEREGFWEFGRGQIQWDQLDSA
jgi:hypothetical protein